MDFAPGNRQPVPLTSTRLNRPIVVLIALLAAILVVALLANGRRGVLALAGVAGIGGLAWAVRRVSLDPFWLIFALVLEETCPYLNVLPFDSSSRWWLRYPLLLGLCMPAVPAIWKSGILKRGYFLGYLIYFGWAAVSISFSKYPAVSAGRLLPTVLLFCALSLIACKVRSGSDVQTVLGRYLMGCGVLLALTAVAAIAFPNSVSIESAEHATTEVFSWVQDEDGLVRFSGFFSQANDVGSLMLVTVCAGLGHWHATSGRRRQLLAIAMIVSVIFGLMADSRSAFVASAAGAASFAIWKYRFRGFAACLCVGVLLVGIYYAMGEGQRTYVNRDIDTFTGRTTVWQFEMSKVAQSPLLGYGFDVEGGLFEDRYFPDWTEFFEGGPLVELHNGYLSIAIGMGFPALMFWLFLLLGPWISLFRREDDNWHLKPLFFFVVVPALLRAFVESGIGEPRYPEGLLLFLCWTLAERYRLGRRAAEASERSTKRVSSGVNFRRLLAEDRAV